MHDGRYGNWVPNPASMATRLVARMRDDDGRVLIPGFGKGARPLTASDRAARAAHPRIIRLRWDPGGYAGLRTDPGMPVSKAVVASATVAAGRPVAILPIMGTSVPIALFHDALGVAVVGLPVVNHDDSQHAANENLRLQNLWDGVQTYAGLMADLNW